MTPIAEPQIHVKKDVTLTISGHSVKDLWNVCEMARVYLDQVKRGEARGCGLTEEGIRDAQRLMEAIFNA